MSYEPRDSSYATRPGRQQQQQQQQPQYQQNRQQRKRQRQAEQQRQQQEQQQIPPANEHDRREYDREYDHDFRHSAQPASTTRFNRQQQQQQGSDNLNAPSSLPSAFFPQIQQEQQQQRRPRFSLGTGFALGSGNEGQISQRQPRIDPALQHKRAYAESVTSTPARDTEGHPAPSGISSVPPAYTRSLFSSPTSPTPPLPPLPPLPPTPPVHQQLPYTVRTSSSQLLPSPAAIIPTYDPQSPAERARRLGYTNSVRTNSTTTPGADNLGETAAGGGIAGIAYGVASANERESGLRALRAFQADIYLLPDGALPSDRQPAFAMYNPREDNPYVPEHQTYSAYQGAGSRAPAAAAGALRGNAGAMAQGNRGPYDAGRHSTALAPSGYPYPNPFGSQASLAPSLTEDAYAGGIPAPRQHQPRNNAALAGTGLGIGGAGIATARQPGPYTDNPLARPNHASWDNDVDRFNPNDIEDDGDDGLNYAQHGRRSVLSFANNRSRSSVGLPAAAGVGAGAGAAAGMRSPFAGLANRDTSGRYNPVNNSSVDWTNRNEDAAEKSQWLQSQSKSRKKTTWIAIVVVIVAILAIAGGVIGGVLGTRAHNNAANGGSGGSTSSADPDKDGLLDASSPSIKALMNNPNLHRVFPGMAYTPLNAQYPACLSNPVSQNNVTKDMAVLSQLTNTIRLYGTDCNQTEMVLTAFDKLGVKDMKVWLAVWLDKNSTTRDRGMQSMQDILKKYGSAPFNGVIVGNEVLFRQDLTAAEMSTYISAARSNLTALNMQLPVASADLGDNWSKNPQLVSDIDVVMSNVHPFFGGLPVDQAAGWAWDFWQDNDVVLTKANATKRNIISEIGWPSGGGQDCGSDTAPCPSGSGAVAGIDQMNKFMDTFVCQSLQNQTNYFWFEAFDEPWKVQFNEPGKEWEDKWGLMDSNRNLKSGLKIPSCTGMSIPASQ